MNGHKAMPRCKFMTGHMPEKHRTKYNKSLIKSSVPAGCALMLQGRPGKIFDLHIVTSSLRDLFFQKGLYRRALITQRAAAHTLMQQMAFPADFM